MSFVRDSVARGVYPPSMAIDPRALTASLAAARDGLAAIGADMGCWRMLRQLASELPFFADLGLVAEVYELIEDVLEREPEAAAAGVDVLRLKALLGFMDLSRGRLVEAWAAFFEAQRQARRPELVGLAHMAAAHVAFRAGDLERAESEFGLAIGALRAGNEPVTALKCEVGLVVILQARDEIQRALERCLELLRRPEADDPRAVAPVTHLIGVIVNAHLERGEPYRARQHAWQAAKYAAALPASKAGAFALFQHAFVEYRLGRFALAMEAASRAERAQSVLDPMARVGTRILKLQCLRRLKRFGEAERLVEAIAADPQLSLMPADRAEFGREALAVARDTLGRSAFRRWIAAVPGQDLPQETELWEERAARAVAVRDFPREVADADYALFDLPGGYALRRRRGEITGELQFRAASLTARSLDALCRRIAAVPDGIEAGVCPLIRLEDLEAELARDGRDGRKESNRRQLRRALVSLGSAQLLELRTQVGVSYVSFPERTAVLVVRDP